MPPNYIYDPEGAPSAALRPGAKCQGTPSKSNVRHVDVTVGGTIVVVPLNDLIVQRLRDSTKLKGGIPHVAHEVRLLLLSYHLRASEFAYTGWFVHARNVHSFLIGKGHNQDEIAAQDFFRGREHDWHNTRRALNAPRRFREYRTAINKLAAHLTYSRLAYARRRFPPDAAITAYLLQLVARFLDRLEPAHRQLFIKKVLR